MDGNFPSSMVLSLVSENKIIIMFMALNQILLLDNIISSKMQYCLGHQRIGRISIEFFVLQKRIVRIIIVRYFHTPILYLRNLTS